MIGSMDTMVAIKVTENNSEKRLESRSKPTRLLPIPTVTENNSEKRLERMILHALPAGILVTENNSEKRLESQVFPLSTTILILL